MVSQQMINIIIKAENQAEEQFQKVKEQVDKIGDAGKNAFDNVSKNSENTRQKMGQLGSKLEKTVENVNKVGTQGSESFQKLSKSEQDAITRFNMLDNTTQKTLNSLANLGTQNSNLVPGANAALSSFSQLNNLTRSWSGSMDYAKTKMGLLGNETNTLKGKIQTTGMAIQTYLGTKWDVVSNKVSSVATNIKSKIGGAFDSIKGKISSVGSSMGKFSTNVRSTGGSLGFLRNAASMATGMIGYDLFNALIEAGRSAINASSQLQYFGQRIRGMSNSDIAQFSKSLETLQTQFKKVNMKAVGASAEEMAVKFNLSKDSLEGLTKATAVMSSAFVKEGRTEEDAILAVSDALDGQFRRLQELGITQDMLKNNGWDGDLQNKNSLLDAMNKTLDQMGFTKTAQDITSLDDAYQALTVSGGQLIEKALVPITPLLVGIVKGLTDAIGAFTSFWDSLPDWGKIAIGVGALALALGILVPALASVELASLPLIPTLYSVAGAVMAISWPVVAVVAAIGLVVLAIYEVGKAFGWWDNVGEMLGAIWAGINRLWSAFINHPDVQAAIQAISGAMQWLWSCISGAVKAILEFFGVSTGGDFDVIGAIITGIGQAWDFVKNAIMAVMYVLWGIGDVFKQVITGQMDLQTALITIWSLIKTNLGPIVLAIAQLVIRLFGAMAQSAVRYVSNLFSGVVRWFSMIPSNVWKWLNATKLKIMSQFLYWVALAKLRAKQFVQNIINFIKTLPGLVYAWLVGVATKIVNAGQQWISNAQDKAKGVVKAVIDYVKTLPQAVYNEFAKIPGKIRDAISAACDAAGQWGRQVVSRLKSAMGINSPGYIQNSVVAEFANTVGRIEDQINPAEKTASKFGKAIVNGFGEVDLGMNDLLDDNSSLIVDANSIVSDRYVIDENFNVNLDLNLTLDFKNLPENVDENNLVKIVEKVMTNPKTLKKLLNSNVFQDIDLKAKRSIQNKRNRSKGIWNS